MLYVLGVWLTFLIVGSSQKFANIISVIREQFIDIFEGANDYSLDQMCGIVSVDILSRLGMGVIGKDTIKGFYRGENLNSKNLEKIGAWIDNTHLHRYWVVGKELPIYELGLGRLIKQACSFMPFLPWNNLLLYCFLLSFLLSRPALSHVLLYKNIIKIILWVFLNMFRVLQVILIFINFY